MTREHLVSPTTRQKEKSEWLYAINRIGNNINQIARHLNMGQDPDDDMLLILAQIQDMANSALKAALKGNDDWEGV